MSKKTTYTCDGHLPNGDNCQRATHNVKHWLTIIGEDISIKNGLPNNRLIEMNNHEDLHFCSKECFMNLFFTNDDGS